MSGVLQNISEYTVNKKSDYLHKVNIEPGHVYECTLIKCEAIEPTEIIRGVDVHIERLIKNEHTNFNETINIADTTLLNNNIKTEVDNFNKDKNENELVKVCDNTFINTEFTNLNRITGSCEVTGNNARRREVNETSLDNNTIIKIEVTEHNEMANTSITYDTVQIHNSILNYDKVTDGNQMKDGTRTSCTDNIFVNTDNINSSEILDRKDNIHDILNCNLSYIEIPYTKTCLQKNLFPITDSSFKENNEAKYIIPDSLGCVKTTLTDADMENNVMRAHSVTEIISNASCAQTDLVVMEDGNDMGISENSKKTVVDVGHHRYISQTRNSILCPNVQIRTKTAAERARKYRARKKAAREAREARESSLHKKCPKTAAERARDYRARKKRTIQAANDVSIPQKRPKTSAERSREYKARKRKKLEAANDSSIPLKRPKTAAERAREYRARKKSEIQTNSVSIHLKRPKTAAEISREYKAGKKEKFQAANGASSMLRRRPKSAAERARDYRARKKKEIQLIKISIIK